jgi:hypothetical protein
MPAPTPNGPVPLTNAAWPIRTSEHVDLWLHCYALLTVDSALVPYFAKGYREDVNALRRQRNVTSQIDANRTRLLTRINEQPSLATGPQFLPFYFGSWDQMRQMVDIFTRANGNPRAAADQTQAQYIAILAASFPTAADRDWLRLFVVSANDESVRFHHEFYTSAVRARANMIARVDSLWQRQWRAPLQRFLNNTQQQNGEIYLTLPLGAEGRTVHFGKLQNAVGVGFPVAIRDAESVLYTFAHEIAGSVAATAIEDNTTPAERRTGAASRYEQSAAVRAGALLLERTIPGAVPGYMRFYLQAAGRTSPPDPRASFTSTFSVPDAVTAAIGRQLDVILGGI